MVATAGPTRCSRAGIVSCTDHRRGGRQQSGITGGSVNLAERRGARRGGAGRFALLGRTVRQNPGENKHTALEERSALTQLGVLDGYWPPKFWSQISFNRRKECTCCCASGLSRHSACRPSSYGSAFVIVHLQWRLWSLGEGQPSVDDPGIVKLSEPGLYEAV